MAKQSGTTNIIGSIDNLCFYKMEGKYYVRMKSSLTGNRIKKDPAFAVTMTYAGLLGMASKIASCVYAKIEKGQRVKGSYRKMTGDAMRLLKNGVAAKVVKRQLMALYVPQPEPKVVKEEVAAVKLKRVEYGEMVLKMVFAEVLVRGEDVKDNRVLVVETG